MARVHSGAKHRLCPVTTERIYSDEEREFLSAVQRHQTEFQRRFPTHSELFGILKSLGYNKGTPTPTPEAAAEATLVRRTRVPRAVLV